MLNQIDLKDYNDEKETIFTYEEQPSLNLPPLRKLSGFYQLQLFSFYTQGLETYSILTNIAPDSTSYFVRPRKQHVESFSNRYFHQHEFYEILFVLKGELNQQIENENKLYRKGDICILNKNIRHSIHSNEDKDFQIALLQISDVYMNSICSDLFQKIFAVEREAPLSIIEHFFTTCIKNDAPEKACLSLTPFGDYLNITDSIFTLLDEIAKETLLPQIGSSYFIKNKIIRLFLLLSTKNGYQTLPIQVNTTTENTIFNKITKIMEKSYGRTTRKELEEALHYSGIYLNEITKKYTGLTIFNYGMTFCMKQAARLLIKTNLSISAISEELGFSNRTHFYEIFKNTYDMTPLEFRKKYKRLLH